MERLLRTQQEGERRGRRARQILARAGLDVAFAHELTRAHDEPQAKATIFLLGDAPVGAEAG